MDRGGSSARPDHAAGRGAVGELDRRAVSEDDLDQRRPVLEHHGRLEGEIGDHDVDPVEELGIDGPVRRSEGRRVRSHRHVGDSDIVPRPGVVDGQVPDAHDAATYDVEDERGDRRGGGVVRGDARVPRAARDDQPGDRESGSRDRDACAERRPRGEVESRFRVRLDRVDPRRERERPAVLDGGERGTVAGERERIFDMQVGSRGPDSFPAGKPQA